MLAVLSDPLAEPARKDRLAIAAAPYLHRRLAEKTAKAHQAEQAERAGTGTTWDDDLSGDWQQ